MSNKLSNENTKSQYVDLDVFYTLYASKDTRVNDLCYTIHVCQHKPQSRNKKTWKISLLAYCCCVTKAHDHDSK